MSRHRASRTLVACAVAAALGWPRPAAADVRMTAPRGCGSVERLRARVAELAPGVAIDADVDLEREVALVRAHVRLTAPTTGERTLEGADCDSVVEAAALVVALSGRLPTPAPPPPPPPPTPNAAAPVPAPAPAPAPAPVPAPPARTIRVHIASFAAGAAGTLPSFGLGAGLAGGVTFTALRAELGVALYAPQRAEIGGGVGGDFTLATANARGCIALVGGTRFELAPCLGVSLDRLAGDGFGATTTTSQVAWIAGPSVGGLASVSLTRALALRATVEAVLPASRQPFVIGNVGSVHRPAGLFGRGQVGAELRF